MKTLKKKSGGYLVQVFFADGLEAPGVTSAIWGLTLDWIPSHLCVFLLCAYWRGEHVPWLLGGGQRVAV